MELLYILLQIIFLLTFFSISYPALSINKNSVSSTIFLNQLIINIVIQINIILVLSFVNISLNLITKIYFSYLLTVFILVAYKNISLLYLNRYYYLAIFLIFFVLSIDISYSVNLDWDSQIVWFYKVLNFYNEGTIKDLINLPLGDGYSYPHLGSLIWAFFWNISLITEEYSGRLIYVFLYIIALLALTEKLKASFFSKIIFFLFLILLSYDYIFFAGSQDILIFCFISFLAFYIHEVFINNIKDIEKLNLLIIVLIFNCLIWIKDEGTVYSLIILFILTFFSSIRLNQKIIMIFSVFFFLILKLVLYNFYNLDIGVNSCCYNISASYIFSNIFSYKTIIFIQHLFLIGFLKNYFFILGVIFLIISFYSKIFDKKNIYIYVFYILAIGFLYGAHIALKENIDFVYLLKVNLHRLIFAISPFFILIVINYLNSLKIFFKSN